MPEVLGKKLYELATFVTLPCSKGFVGDLLLASQEAIFNRL